MKDDASAEWKKHVFPHGPIKPIAPDVWQVTGSTAKAHVPRNMVIYRMPDRTLWLHSVIALDENGMRELLALGRPSILVVPNAIHRLDAKVYKDRFKDIKVVCPASARKKVEQVVAVDDVCENVLPMKNIACIRPAGLKDFELAYFLPVPSGRVMVVTDCLFNLPRGKGFAGWLFWKLGSTGFFGMTQIGKWLLLKDREAFANWLGEIAKRGDIVAVCVAHGEEIRAKVSLCLEEARARLHGDYLPRSHT